jgi:hypothetical protein
MGMTKKHYIKLAAGMNAALKEAVAKEPHSEVWEMAVKFAMAKVLVHVCVALKQDNRLFDEDKFYDAVYK